MHLHTHTHTHTRTLNLYLLRTPVMFQRATTFVLPQEYKRRRPPISLFNVGID